MGVQWKIKSPKCPDLKLKTSWPLPSSWTVKGNMNREVGCGMHLVQTGADVSLALTTTLWKTKDCEGLCCPLLGWGTDPTGYSSRMLPQAVMKTTHREGPYSFHLDGASEGLSKESYSLTSTRRPTVRVKVQEPSKGMWSLLRHVGLCIG